MFLSACKSLARHLRSHPAYVSYPRYAALLVGAVWLAGLTPVKEITQGSPLVGLMSDIGLIGGATVALFLGVVGIFRPGSGSIALSLVGFTWAAWMLAPALPYSESVLLVPIELLTWPLAVFPALFLGKPAAVVAFWTLYGMNIYAVSRWLIPAVRRSSE